MSELVGQWQATIPDHVIALAWSPDGHALAAAAVSGPVHVFDAATGVLKYTCAGHGFGTTALQWHPSGQHLATAGQDRKVRLWDAVAGKLMHELDGGAAWVEQLAWSPKGDYLASAAGKKLRLWNPDGTLAQSYPDAASTIAAIAWNPTGREFVTGGYGGVTFYRPESATPDKVFEWQGSVIAVAWSPDGKMLAGGGQDSTVHFWYVQNGEDLQMSGYPAKVRELAWNTTSLLLATGGGEVVVVWNCGGKGPAGSTPIGLEFHERTITALAFQRRGPKLVSGDPDGVVVLWQPAGGKKPLATAEFGEGITQLVWSPRDTLLAVGGENGTVAVVSI